MAVAERRWRDVVAAESHRVADPPSGHAVRLSNPFCLWAYRPHAARLRTIGAPRRPVVLSCLRALNILPTARSPVVRQPPMQPCDPPIRHVFYPQFRTPPTAESLLTGVAMGHVSVGTN